MDLIKLDPREKNNQLFEFEKKILDVAEGIPFGNSDFQNRMASVNSELSPHRALRASCLRIIDRIQALKETYFDLKEKEIEIKKLERDLEKETDELEKELILIKIEKIKSRMPYLEKLIKDAIREIESLYPIVESIGKITREEFEAMESEHFKKKYELAMSMPNIQLEYALNWKDENDLYKIIVEKGKELLNNEEIKKISNNNL